MGLETLSDADLMALKAGDLSKVSDAGLESMRAPTAAPAAAPAPTAPSDTAVAANASNKALAGLPDALLNTPNKVMNLGKAAFGTAATAMGRPDLAPDLTPDPNYASRGMSAAGLTKPEWEPANGRQRVIDAAVQTGVGAAISPTNSVRGLVTNTLTGATGGTAAGVTKEATGSDTAASMVGMLTPVVVQAGVGAARQRVADAEMRRSQNEVRDKTLAEGREKGYVVSPSEVNPSVVNKILESIAGKAATRQEASIRNQATTTSLAAEELGMPKGTALTEGKLTAYRDKVAAPYREVAALSPTASYALEQLKDARFNASAYAKHYDRSADPNSLAAAKNLQQKADQLETQLEQHAQRAGKPDLIDSLRDARTKIAKSYDIERALNVGDASVSSKSLGRAVDSGKPLSGNLETAGKFAESFKHVTQDGAQAPGVSKVAAALSSILGVGGYGALGPAGAALAAIPLASGPTRSLMLSKPYQDYMAKPNYSPGIATKGVSQLSALGPEQQAIQAALMARAFADSQQNKENR